MFLGRQVRRLGWLRRRLRRERAARGGRGAARPGGRRCHGLWCHGLRRRVPRGGGRRRRVPRPAGYPGGDGPAGGLGTSRCGIAGRITGTSARRERMAGRGAIGREAAAVGAPRRAFQAGLVRDTRRQVVGPREVARVVGRDRHGPAFRLAEEARTARCRWVAAARYWVAAAWCRWVAAARYWVAAAWCRWVTAARDTPGEMIGPGGRIGPWGRIGPEGMIGRGYRQGGMGLGRSVSGRVVRGAPGRRPRLRCGRRRRSFGVARLPWRLVLGVAWPAGAARLLAPPEHGKQCGSEQQGDQDRAAKQHGLLAAQEPGPGAGGRCRGAMRPRWRGRRGGRGGRCRGHRRQRAVAHAGSGRVRWQHQDPSRLEHGGIVQPPAARLKPALVHVEDRHGEVAVMERLHRDLVEEFLVPVLGRLNDVVLDPSRVRGGRGGVRRGCRGVRGGRGGVRLVAAVAGERGRRGPQRGEHRGDRERDRGHVRAGTRMADRAAAWAPADGHDLLISCRA